MRNDTFSDGELAKAIYLKLMSAMKEVLNLGEFKIGSRKSEEYKYFKKIVMDQFYNSMSEVFEAMEKKGVLRQCACGTGIRQGYKPCDKCNGAGHCNSEAFEDFIKQIMAQSEDEE